ncbi:MAG: hypothetical protein IJ222_02035, partial [Bacteroidales bacterium]|nr:hypothetical protein [Bacteroidales bacterium]
LLSHLVMSENFTRPGILSGDSLPEDGKFRPLEMELKYYDGTRFLDEKEAAGVLAGLNIALPGGTMSKHAFFNILENFIRNSAKYDQDDFKDGKLLITIAVIPREGSYDFVIHDNKGNASKVLPKLEEHLASLRILDWKGAVDRSSKGLKEMLFSSVWMRPSTYEGRGFSEIINLIQSEPDGSRKLDMIRRYGFSFISVGDNLGLLLNLPAFHFSRSLDLGGVKDGSGLASHLLNFSSDIAVVRSSRREAEALGLSSRMARVYYEEDFRREDFESFVSSSGIEGGDAAIAEDTFRFKGILDRRFAAESGGNIDNVCLWLGDRKDSRRLPRDVSRIVYFERHLRNKVGGFDAYRNYACVDSISGDNFTITLRDQFEAGVTPRGSYRSWNDYILGLKIKESALTRITLIDERLFNRMMGENTGEELSCKNIRVLSARLSSFDGGNIAGVLEGNSFRDGSPRTHFLSIHLGLIEKLIQSEWSGRRWKGESVEGKAARIMEEITGHFAGPDGDIHVCIHSGRGNFSKELAGPLSSFPFLNLSALESAFSNSKYLLCQLFYNTR